MGWWAAWGWWWGVGVVVAGGGHLTAAQRPPAFLGSICVTHYRPGRFFGPVFGHKLRAERFILATHYAARRIIFRYKFKLPYLYQVRSLHACAPVAF